MKFLLITFIVVVSLANYYTENVDFSMQGINWDGRCYVGKLQSPIDIPTTGYLIPDDGQNLFKPKYQPIKHANVNPAND